MKQYFIHDGQYQQGPFDIEQLKNIKFSKEHMVWYEGMENWKPAGEIEELKSLFLVVPPPLPKTTNIPPPMQAPKPVTEAPKNKKNKLLYLLIGAGTALILLTAVITMLVAKSFNSDARNDIPADSVAIKTDALKSGEQTINSTGKDAAQNSGTKATTNKSALDSKQSEEAQKDAYRKNWSKHVFARANYSSGPFGIIVNPTVTVTNSLPYSVNEITVWLNYMLSTGGTWRSEKVTFYNVGPNSTSTKNAPPTDRGSSIQTRISKVTSSSLGLYYSD